jgi:hypothetical protein
MGYLGHTKKKVQNARTGSRLSKLERNGSKIMKYTILAQVIRPSFYYLLRQVDATDLSPLARQMRRRLAFLREMRAMRAK